MIPRFHICTNAAFGDERGDADGFVVHCEWFGMIIEMSFYRRAAA
jgi:hypothetical protein